MGRKNVSPRVKRRRKHTVEYVITEMRSDYEVTLTNGSGFEKIVVTGTSVSAWNWCIRAGLEPGGNLEGYHPIDIRAVGKNEAVFSVI